MRLLESFLPGDSFRRKGNGRRHCCDSLPSDLKEAAIHSLFSLRGWSESVTSPAAGACCSNNSVREAGMDVEELGRGHKVPAEKRLGTASMLRYVTLGPDQLWESRQGSQL